MINTKEGLETFLKSYYTERRYGQLGEFVNAEWNNFFNDVLLCKLETLNIINDLIDTENDEELFIEKAQKVIGGDIVSINKQEVEEKVDTSELLKKVSMLETAVEELMMMIPNLS